MRETLYSRISSFLRGVTQWVLLLFSPEASSAIALWAALSAAVAPSAGFSPLVALGGCSAGYSHHQLRDFPPAG